MISSGGTPAQKQLVVTADDLGLHEKMNEGSIRAHRDGIVTAVSLVANGRAFDHAVDLVRDEPALDAGVHLTFVEEVPLSPRSEVPSLLDDGGTFLPSFRSFSVRYLYGGVDLDELTLELRSQIERVLRAGLMIRHINSHQHLHLFPRIFERVLGLAEEFRIPNVRLAEDYPRTGAHDVRTMSIRVLSTMSARARNRWKGRTVTSMNDRAIGILRAGHLSEPHLLALLDSVDGVTELVTHPGIETSEIRKVYDWGYEWDEETAALCDPRVRNAMAEKGIGLTRFSELTHSTGPDSTLSS